ncbi:hypothetical protein NEAUS05_2243 [Nematocida ausubeli]|nr:hypothetical protein NEAUS05_2243 [Nematocida ausubeli]
MKILSIDLGSYKTVLASSDTSAGEIILSRTGGRSTKMAIDYRNKIRSFGNINVTCKDREKVAEAIRSEIESLAAQIAAKGAKKADVPKTSHVYGLLNHLITHYAETKNISTNELEVEIIVPCSYTELHKNILIKILELINPKIGVECISDSIALCAYYLSRRSSDVPKIVGFIDIGSDKSTLTTASIVDTEIQVIGRSTVNVGGSAITEHLLRKIYNGLDKSIPDLFSKEEFGIRNLKKIEWIKGAIFGLSSVTTQVDASYDRSVGVTITKADIEEVAGAFSELEVELRRMREQIEKQGQITENTVIDVEITGGSSKMFFIEDIIQKTLNKKPEMHLNADESVALGGVYRRLMESPFHRFRYDPVIWDTTSHPYYIKVVGSSTNPRTIMVFDKHTRYVKEMKSKVAGKKYDPKIVLLKCPKKTVKIAKIDEESVMTVYAGDYPVYSLKIKEKTVQPEDDSKTEEKKEAVEEANDEKKAVKLVISLTSTGGIHITSDDVEAFSILDEMNMIEMKRSEDRYINKERMVVEIESKINSIQTGIYNTIELLSDSLSILSSAEKATESLWEHSQTVEELAASAKTMQEVTAFEDTLEKEVSLESEWNDAGKKLSDNFTEKYGVTITPPVYPGIHRLFDIFKFMQSEVIKEMERQERQRKYQMEQEQLEEQRRLAEKKRLEEESQQQDQNAEHQQAPSE